MLTCFLAGCGGSNAEARSALEARVQELQQENQGLRARLAQSAQSKGGSASTASCAPDAPGERRPDAGDGVGTESPGDGTAPPARPTLEIVKLVPGAGRPGHGDGHARISDEPVSASALQAGSAEPTEESGAPRPLLRLRGSEEPKLQPLDNAATQFGQADSPRTQP